MPETTSQIRLNCVAEADRLSLTPLAPEHWEISDNKTGEILGTVKQVAGSRHEVELFYGKGGFMAMVSSPTGLKYFVLPGGAVQAQGVEITLSGSPIAGHVDKPAASRPVIRPQAHATQATILGAGLATRFERVSGESTNCSKPGVPLVGRRTVIECIADVLAQHGFSRLIVNTYFKPDSIKASLTRSAAGEVLYIDEESPSGTAGGLRKMLTDPRYADLLDESKPLLVVQGDAVTDADFSELMEAHVRRAALVTIGCQLVEEDDVEKFGIIVTDRSGEDGQSGCVTGFQEKPPKALAQSRLGNTGFYILSPRAYPLVREIYRVRLEAAREKAAQTGEKAPDEVGLDFANDIFPEILRHSQSDSSLGPFWAQTVGGYWSDIGNPRQYLESVHDIYAGKVNLPMPDDLESYYKDRVVYWEGARTIAEREGARLEGNVIVALPYAAQS